MHERKRDNIAMRLSQEAIRRMMDGRSGGGGGGSSFDPSALAGMASQAWVEEGYISKAFWNELFIIHKKVTTVVMNGETEVSRTVKTDADAGVDPFDPNETPSETSTTDSETGYVTTVTTEIESIEARKGVWTDYFLSALGKNSSGGGGGATLFEPLLSINESGLAAPADAQDGMTVVWDKNTHKWKYGATGGGTSLSLTPGCLLDTVDNYSYNDYIGQWSQQNIKGSAFLYDIGNANKVYYSASGNHIPNGIRLLWYDKNLFLIGKTDYGIQSEYSVPTGAVYVSFVLYYSITEIAYIEDGLSNIHFSFLGNDKIYISKDLEYPYGNPDTYNVNLDDYSDSYIEGVASDADYKKFFTDGRGKSICIPFSLFKYYDYVEIKQPSPSKAGISRIHFLKKEPKTNGETVEYSDFYTTNVQINKGNNTIFYKIPDDARYILIYAYWGNEDRRPERIALRTANSLGLDDMSKYDERVNTALRNPNQYQIKILHWNIGNYSNGGAETSINNSNYTAKSNSFKAFINKYKDYNVYINEWNSVFAKLSGGNVYAGPELWDYGYSYNSYVRCNDWDELGCVPTNTQIGHKVGVLTSLAGMYLESGGYYSMPKPYVIYRHYIGGGSLYILHTHLPTNLSDSQTRTVFAEMVNIMSGYTNVIICGDFNNKDNPSSMDVFRNAGYTVANNSEYTYPYSSSTGQIYDWFAYRGYFTNVEFKVCKDAVDQGYSDGDINHMLSDHWPIAISLEYTGSSIVPGVRGAYRFNPTTNLPEWHNGIAWNSNVSSATKLQTARLLWGNSFDGTADVNGDITITKTGTTPALVTVSNGSGTVRFAAYETNRGIWDASGSGWLIGTGPTSSNPNTFLMRGNVGIGKSSPSYKLDVDGTINCTSIRIGGYTITADTQNQGLRINSAGLYADTYISALGANSGGGGGGGVTLNEPLSSINNASLGTPSGTDMAIVWSGSAWTYKQMSSGGGGVGTVTSIIAGTGLSGGTITSSGTIAINSTYQGYISHGETAYGWGDHSLAGYATPSSVTIQMQNYVKIQSGTITIGDTSITPLTSDSGTFWGQSWVSGGTVSGGMSNVGNIVASAHGTKYIEGFRTIELYGAAASDYGGYIDFHFNDDSNDFTSRIIEDASGRIYLNASNGVRIGNGVLKWDSYNNALKVEKYDGTTANFYATGGVSALGVGTGGSVTNLAIAGKISFSDNYEIKVNAGDLYIGDSTSEQYVKVSDICSWNGSSNWYITTNGVARFQRIYLDSSRYIYVSSGTLYYYNGSTAKEIALV